MGVCESTDHHPALPESGDALMAPKIATQIYRSMGRLFSWDFGHWPGLMPSDREPRTTAAPPARSSRWMRSWRVTATHAQAAPPRALIKELSAVHPAYDLTSGSPRNNKQRREGLGW